MEYIFKKLISRFFFPVPLVLELLILGLVLQRFSKWKRTGKGLLVAGVLLLAIFGYNLGTEPVLRSIERKFPPLTIEIAKSLPAKTDILVLGQGLSDELGLPANSRIGEVYLARIIEAVRVSRMMPNSRILVSVAGYSSADDKTNFLEGIAEIMGIENARLVLLDGARDTADEIDMALGQARSECLVVVSSASHLPRAIKMFEGRGVTTVPAPCAYRVLDVADGPWSPLELFPNARNLVSAENAIYEVMGNLWVRVRGRKSEVGGRRTERCGVR